MNPTIRIRQARERGIAMILVLILVLILVAASSIVAVGLITTTSTQARLTRSSGEQVQARYMSESGINLGLYYLKNPTLSPVALSVTPEGVSYYPGESNITIPGMDGQISIAVTRNGYGKFVVTSKGTSDGHTCTQSTSVNQTKSLTFKSAAVLAGNQKLTASTTITGGLETNGSLTTVAGSLLQVGVIIATNGSSFGGTNVGAGSDAPAMPTSEVTLMANMPYYYYNGVRYTAKTISTNYTGGTLLDTNTTANPLNVWYHTGGTFTGTTTLNGTLVSTSTSDGGGLRFDGNITITPLKNNFPALVVKNDLIIKDTPRSLKFNGVTYVGGKIAPTGLNTILNNIIVKGVFVGPSTNVFTSFGGILSITYDANKATLSGFSDPHESVQRITASAFEESNGRPR